MSLLLSARDADPLVFAVVVCFNGAQWIETCLKHLIASTLKIQIVVVDNASTDDTVIACNAFGGIEIVRNDSNLGFGRANNIGISYALARGADYVLLVNQDVYVDPEMAKCLTRELESAPGTGIAAPLQWREDGLQLDRTFLRYYLAEYAGEFLSDAVLGHAKATYPVESMPAAVWLCSRRFLEQVGGFDPIFFMYCEDDDLCRRARRHGFSVALVASATFIHTRGFHSSASSESWPVRVRRKRVRLTSKFLLIALDPISRAHVQIWRAAVSGLAHATVEFLNHGDTATLCAGILAVGGGLMSSRAVVRHRTLVGTPGAHWL